LYRVVVKDVLYPSASPKYQTYGVAEDVFDINVETASQYEMCLYNGHDEADDGIMRSYGFALRLEGLADLDVELGKDKDTADGKQLEQIEVCQCNCYSFSNCREYALRCFGCAEICCHDV
jgi:hypothetical protein